MFLLASLIAASAIVTVARAPADTAARASGDAVCATGATISATVAADLRAALDAHGGAVRWDPQRGPLRVWMQRRPEAAADVSTSLAEWRRTVSDAVGAWRGVVPGLAFVLAPDSTRADVLVTWERDLESVAASGDLAFRTAGRTTLVPAGDGRAVVAHVRLAVFAPGGARYSVEDVRAVARHEFGHALGLAHHAAASSVMAPLVRTERITDEDRATLRALYALPIGARCAAP